MALSTGAAKNKQKFMSPSLRRLATERRNVSQREHETVFRALTCLSPESRAYEDHFSDVIVDAETFLWQGETCLPGTPFNFRGDYFPIKLYQLLQDSPRNGTSHIVSWDDYGRSFRIYDRKAFEELIMPRYVSCHLLV